MNWRERLLAWRHRLIANPKFQRWAASSPFTRAITKRKAQTLFDLTAGFVYSQILYACVELDLFTKLNDGPVALGELAKRLDLPIDRCVVLLDGAAALELVVKYDDGRYGLADLGAALIGTPGVSEMIKHHRLLYRDLADPIALLRNPEQPTELNHFWAYAHERPYQAMGCATVGAYSGLMTASQGFIADDVLDAYVPKGVLHWADIGGGEGAFIQQVAARHPSLKLTLFDLPQVAARAGERLVRMGFGNQITVSSGDFFADPLPQADIISLIRVLYDHQDDAVTRLLNAVFNALSPGGQILVAEPMADTPGAERMGAAYFGFYLLAMGGGRSRSLNTLSQLLENAGFVSVSVHRTRRPMLVSVLSANKPETAK